MAGQLTEMQSNMDGELSRRSTEQRQLILETIQQARQKQPSIRKSIGSMACADVTEPLPDPSITI